MVCQQFGGINGVCFYTGEIFETAGIQTLINIAFTRTGMQEAWCKPLTSQKWERKKIAAF